MNTFGALYLRISRDKGENEDTLQNHREIMQDFCQRNGYTYESYEEIVSGGKQAIEERPQLQNLISNIEKYEALFCISLDRLSRNGLVSQQIKQLCIDYDVKIITPSQSFDLANSDEDKLLYDISSVFATREYEMIGKRNKVNKIQRANRGEWISGKPAFGYRRNPKTKKLEVYEPEAEVVRYIFKLHSEGLGSFKIVDILNAEGFKPQLSNAFNLPTVKRIMQNPVYKGTVVFNNRKRVKEGGKYLYKVVETIETPNAHPAIIPPEQWEQANRERVTRTEKAKAIREKPANLTGTTLLKDLIFCGMCGRKMSIRKEQNGVYILKRCEYLLPGSPERCSNSGIKMEYLEEELLSKLKKHKENLKKELKLLKNQDLTNIKADIQDSLKHFEVQIKDNLNRQDKLIEVIERGLYSFDEIKNRKQALISEQQALEASKEKLEQELKNINVSSPIEHVTHVINLLDKFETLTPEAQNKALKQFVKAIHFTRIIPEDIRKLSSRNPERREFPFEYTIEYF